MWHGIDFYLIWVVFCLLYCQLYTTLIYLENLGHYRCVLLSPFKIILSHSMMIYSSQEATPQEFLKQFDSGALLLPPPQIYELGRLVNFDSYDELKKFACERERMGMEQLFPVKIFTSDGMISCLPGERHVNNILSHTLQIRSRIVLRNLHTC